MVFAQYLWVAQINVLCCADTRRQEAVGEHKNCRIWGSRGYQSQDKTSSNILTLEHVTPDSGKTNTRQYYLPQSGPFETSERQQTADVA